MKFLKHSLLLLLIVLAGFTSCDQKKRVESSDKSDLTVIIDSDEIIDSVYIGALSGNQGGYLEYSREIKIDYPDSINDIYNIVLFQNGRRIKSPLSKSQFWLHGDNIVLKGKLKDFIQIDTVINSPVYYAGKRYTEYYKRYKNSANEKDLRDSLALVEIDKNYQSTYSLAIADQFIRRNKNDREKLKQLFELIQDQSMDLKNHNYFRVHRELSNLLSVDSIDLSSFLVFNGKQQLQLIESEKSKLLLDLWFVNCPPCLEDHKKFSKNLSILDNNDIELIGISIDQEHQQWNDYLEKNNYNWKNYRQADKPTVSDHFSVSAYPEYILIDSNGQVLQRFDSFDDVEKYLSKLEKLIDA